MEQIKKPNFERAKQEALNLLEYCGYKKPPVDPMQICRELNIGVSFRKFTTEETKKISGFFYAKENMICVNVEEAITRQFFTAAHELGHKILHEDYIKSKDYKILYRNSFPISDPYEQEANTFAANLLIPKFMLDEYFSPRANYSELAKIFCVSEEFLSNRIRFLYVRK